MEKVGKYNIRDERNISMLMDFYELTMSQGYIANDMQQKEVAFDLFFRKVPDGGGFVVFAGLEQIIQYIKGLHFSEEDIAYLRSLQRFDESFLTYLKNFKFRGSIYAVREGTPVYPKVPLLTVVANIIEAQLIETALLVIINHQSLIATKANRMKRAAGDCMVMELGARRAQGFDAANFGARAAYIGGVDASATLSANQYFSVPVVGTMAHSWIQLFGNTKASEYEAFCAYAKVYEDNCSLLIDTFDVLHSGLPNAIKVAKEYLEPRGKRLQSVRLDSGDLAYLSKKVREELDKHQMSDCKIIVSNSIDEFLIHSLIAQGAKIDIFGIGERLITAKSDPVFGGVYKLAAVKEKEENGQYVWKPRIKKSENIEKITFPGLKRVWRITNPKTGFVIMDILTMHDEKIDPSHDYSFIDPEKPWVQRTTKKGFIAEELLIPIFEKGECVYECPSLKEIRKYAQKQIQDHMWEEEKRFENPHKHYVNLSLKLYRMQMELLNHIADEEE